MHYLKQSQNFKDHFILRLTHPTPLIKVTIKSSFLKIKQGKKNLTLLKVKVKSLGRVLLFETPWTVAYQVPLSMGFSRQ